MQMRIILILENSNIENWCWNIEIFVTFVTLGVSCGPAVNNNNVTPCNRADPL